jgi:hypothetical protein
MHRSNTRIALRMFTAGFIALAGNATAAELRTYSMTGAAVTIDGISPFVVKSMSGGSGVGDIVVENTAATGQFRKKHLAGVKYQDLSLGITGLPTPAITAWLNQALSGARAEKGGYVSVLDAQMNESSRLTWFQALVSKVELPELDASSKNAGEFKLTLSPQRTARSGSGGKVASTISNAKQKVFLTNNFKITVDGLDLAFVNHIDPLAIRFKSSTNPVGELRDYERSPGAVDVSNLVFTIDVARASTLFAWYDSFVTKGESTQDKERGGKIEYLSPDLKTVLFTVGLNGLGFVRLDLEPIEAGKETVQRLRAEMYIESVTLGSAPG